MATLFTKGTTTLAVGQALSGVAREATTFRVTCGRVWLTVAGMRQDYWLRAGSTMVVPAGYLVVMEAHGGNAQFEVVRTARRTTAWSFLKRPRVVTACLCTARA